MAYTLLIEPDVERKLRKLTTDQQDLVRKPMFALLEEPRPHNAKRLKGSAGKEGWRIRVGKLRILYWIEEAAQIITIYDIDTRDRVYEARLTTGAPACSGTSTRRPAPVR